MTVDRVNRTLLTLLGVGLVAIGVLWLQARSDPLGLGLAEPGVVYQRLMQRITADPILWWSSLLTASVVLLGLCLVWGRAQFVRRGGRGIGQQEIVHNAKGRTEVDPSAIARVVAADFRSVDGVSGSAVRLLTLLPTTVLVAGLDLDRDADPRLVRRDVEQVLGRLSCLMGSTPVDAEVRLRLAVGTPDRVR